QPAMQPAQQPPSPMTAAPRFELTDSKARPSGARLSVPEASGAVYVDDPGAPHLLVVSDSGHKGFLARIDPATGAIARTWSLPLGPGASDDLEGLSVIGDTLYAITSSGWMRHWRLADDGSWALVRPAYPIAARDGADARYVCPSGERINCGRNYEGLCLRRDARPGSACAGFAASK